MAQVIVTFKIMPESPESDLAKINAAAKEILIAFGAKVAKEDVEPVAFGLKAVKLMVIYDEKKGGTDQLEADMSKIPHVVGVEVVDVRRAIG